MRSALFVSALLATALFGGTALAERTSDDSNSRHYSSAQDLKERVLHERSIPQQASRPESVRSAEHAPARIASFRGKGENYENYGRGTQSSATVPTTASHATSAMPSKLAAPGRSHGDIVDSSSRGNSTRKGNSLTNSSTKPTVGSTQMSWTPGGKNVRSFVHSVNDKGETNNNIHGATASAMKMRTVANIIMKTAISDPHVKAFSWSTAGGDSQSLFPGD